MKRLALLLCLCVSVPLEAQESDSFDPGGYVQVELILFTTETDLEASNRTGVLPELLERTDPRHFPLDLVGIQGASLTSAVDTSWPEAEWALIKPGLMELNAHQLARGVRWFLEGSGEVSAQEEDGSETPELAVPREPTDVLAHPEGLEGEQASALFQDPLLADPSAETDPVSPASEKLEAPKELPLWERYRIWFSELLSNCFSQLEESEWRLGAATNSLRSDPQFRVLMHAAWIQPIGREPSHVLLHGGSSAEVGVLSLWRLAFVEAEIRMWRPLGQGYAELRKTRPLRLGRNYYLDHPLMGAVIRVDPIRVPAEFR